MLGLGAGELAAGGYQVDAHAGGRRAAGVGRRSPAGSPVSNDLHNVPSGFWCGWSIGFHPLLQSSQWYLDVKSYPTKAASPAPEGVGLVVSHRPAGRGQP